MLHPIHNSLNFITVEHSLFGSTAKSVAGGTGLALTQETYRIIETVNSGSVNPKRMKLRLSNFRSGNKEKSAASPKPH